MTIPQYAPEDIESILCDRLSSTNMLWSKRDVDDIDQERVLFFKYYFDISAGIEAALRGIIYEYCSSSLGGKAMKAFGKPHDSTVAFFVKWDDFKAITNVEKLLENTNQSDFEKYLKYVSMFTSTTSLIKTFNDYSIISDVYERVRRTRNTLAHGLKAMDSNVDFSITHLSDFIFIFYLTLNYYSTIYKNHRLDKSN